MDFIVELLKKDLSELRDYLQFVDQIKNDILKTSSNFSYLKSRSKKKFDYTSIIISLYGFIENYIEKFCFEYIENIEKIIPSYELLEVKFKENHFNLSIELVKKISDNKHAKFAHINKEKVITNLNHCITIRKNYKLNKEAFTINTGNLKHSKIRDIYMVMNIPLDEKLKQIDGFNLNTENVFNKIDDLVDRRNEIAHGNIQDILDSTAILPYIDFVDKYLVSIGKILQNELIQLNYLNKKNNSILINKTTVYKGNILGILDAIDLGLKVGDEILIEKSNKRLISSEIINIKHFESGTVTIKLNKNIRASNKFYKYKVTKNS
jgi:hypothetical protein